MISFNQKLRAAMDTAESIPAALGSLHDALNCLPVSPQQKGAKKAVRVLRQRINTLHGRSLVILNHCERRKHGFAQV